jgi:hypothetical protein
VLFSFVTVIQKIRGRKVKFMQESEIKNGKIREERGLGIVQCVWCNLRGRIKKGECAGDGGW